MLKRFTMAPEKKNMGMPDRLEMSRETPNTEPVPPSSRSRLYAKFSITPLDSPIANTIEKKTCPTTETETETCNVTTSHKGTRVLVDGTRDAGRSRSKQKKKTCSSPKSSTTQRKRIRVELF